MYRIVTIAGQVNGQTVLVHKNESYMRIPHVKYTVQIPLTRQALNSDAAERLFTTIYAGIPDERKMWLEETINYLQREACTNLPGLTSTYLPY
jgi:hypothetical protein